MDILPATPDEAETLQRICLEAKAYWGYPEEFMRRWRALVGLPDREYTLKPDRGLSGQRGIHWPPPPLDISGKPVGAPWGSGCPPRALRPVCRH